jgi:hypothetical protein
MNGLQVQLIVCLDRHEAHVLALNGFCDRFGVDKIVLVRLHKRLHELSCDKPHIVALLPQDTAQEVSS